MYESLSVGVYIVPSLGRLLGNLHYFMYREVTKVISTTYSADNLIGRLQGYLN